MFDSKSFVEFRVKNLRVSYELDNCQQPRIYITDLVSEKLLEVFTLEEFSEFCRDLAFNYVRFIDILEERKKQKVSQSEKLSGVIQDVQGWTGE